MKISLMLDTGMPEAGGPVPAPAPTKPSVEEDVRHALDCIESGHDSGVEWLMIKKLYTELGKMKKTPRVANLQKMIEPVLARYGYHKTAGES